MTVSSRAFAISQKDRVRTPEGAERFGQPIGTVIRRDAEGNVISYVADRAADIAAMGSPKTGEPAQRDARVSSVGYTQRMRSKAKDKQFSVAQKPANGKGPSTNPPNVKGSKHLWELPSDYEGYDLWVDARNLRMYVAQEDDGMWVAYDVNSEVIEEGTDKRDLIKNLEAFAGIELKPGFKWATDAERKKLVTPPAWRSVQIPIDQKKTRVKMQGFDYKGKQQTQYTAEQETIRDAVKFERIKQLQKKMRTLDAYLAKNTGDENADAIMMMRRLGMRPDRGGSGADVETFGATTLQAQHVKVTPTGLVTLTFTPGKRKAPITIKMRDKVLADMLRERLKTRSRNQPLFEVNVLKVEKEFRSVVGQGFNLKDLRTLKANAIALDLIRKRGEDVPSSQREFSKWRNEVGDAVAAVLGNTRKVSLDSYINPVVFEEWAVDPSWL
jgi:DNA topoisomerase IB